MGQNKLQFLGTQGNFTPEPNPTYNPFADAYQVALLQDGPTKGQIIPGFAFGKDYLECMSNAHLFANSKLVLTALCKLMDLHAQSDQPEPKIWVEVLEECQEAIKLSLGQYKIVGG